MRMLEELERKVILVCPGGSIKVSHQADVFVDDTSLYIRNPTLKGWVGVNVAEGITSKIKENSQIYQKIQLVPTTRTLGQSALQMIS